MKLDFWAKNDHKICRYIEYLYIYLNFQNQKEVIT